ncbi:VWA domain-containing protein [Oceaniglobus indicus]|uniref:VWA domain-containing protein n=1 Tax=Oceaniglobus indicus TaxID=2047749 RepID=UPI000C19E93C|nr:VWA domain-containing protein [Oceaniglobus indicus]
MRMITSGLTALGTLALAAGLAGTAPARAAEDVVIVYDASGSMWGQIDGTSKIEIARDVMADLADGWDSGTNLGLVAYGHRRQGDCTDIETLVAPGQLDKAGFIGTVNAIKPVGKTPISAAVQHAADLLSYRDTPATVVLISDGVETCNADPCALSAQLAKQGIGFTVHVVGFDLKDDAHASLSCIAENTGGVFVPAGNADELHAALEQVQTAMVTEPEPEPEPELPQVTLSAPAEVVTGAAFDFGWDGTINAQDFLTIVAADADDNKIGDHVRARDNTTASLTAPGTPGLYELRYVLENGRRTLARAAIEVVESEVTVTAPAEVVTGAAFDFGWDGTINAQDFLTIVAADADDNKIGDHVRARGNTTGSLTAPGTPGLYELRYVLENGRRTLARAVIEVVESEVTVTAPAEVVTGAAFDFGWDGTINAQDFLTIVAADADDNKIGDHVRARDTTTASLTAPGTPGLYELRYVLENGRRTLARAAIEVVESEVGITSPGTVRAGETVDVTWSSTINSSDFITIVPAGTDESRIETHIRAGDATTGRLTAPDTPGIYEIRYVLENGRRTLASAPLEVVDADAPLDQGAALSVPERAAPGATITVTWTGGSDSDDQRLSIARKDQPDFSWISVHKIGAQTSMELALPDEPGTYEVRFLDITGRAVLGRSVVEVE